jgi:hypothetical protein
MVPPQDLPLLVIDLSGSVLSLVSCLGLLCSLYQLPSVARCRLFPRQVLWLCLADIAYAVVRLTEHLHWAIPVDLCHYFWLVMATTNVSFLLEISICLGFALKVARCSRCLQLLDYGGFVSLILGTAVVLLEPYQKFYGQLGHYSCSVHGAGTVDTVFIALLLTCLSVSFGCFVFVRVMARASNEAVLRRTSIQSAAYMVKSLILVGLVFVWWCTPLERTHPAVRIYIDVAIALQDFNGAANVATYFFQSRYARPSIFDRAKNTRGDSYRVAFAEGVQEV